MKTPILSYIGHRGRECIVHTQRILQSPGHPRLLIFPSFTRDAASSNLRGYAMGRALQKLNWRVTVVPPQLELSQRQRIVRSERPDVILIQKSTHILNRPSFYPESPTVFDLDDADFLNERSTEIVAECCRESRAVVAGSHFVAEWCRTYNSNTSVIWTCSPIPSRVDVRAPSDRDKVVTWAPLDALANPHEATFIQEIILKLAARMSFSFWVYGIRDRGKAEAFVQPIRQAGISVKLFEYMSYQDFIRSLDDVAVGLQPLCLSSPYSQGKSFGKVLAYFTSHVATVASDALEHPFFFRHGVNGMLADSADDFVESSARLLEDDVLRTQIAENAYKDFCEQLSTDVGARQLDKVLRDVLVSR